MSLSSQYKTLRYIIAADALSAVIGVVAWLSANGGAPTGHPLRLFALSALVVLWMAFWLLAFQLSGLYERHSEPRHAQWTWVLRLLMLGSFPWMAFALFAHAEAPVWVSLAPLLPALTLQAAVTLALRATIVAWRGHILRSAHWKPQALLVGGGERALRLLAELDRTTVALRPQLVGYVDTLKAPLSRYAERLEPRLPRIGHIDDLQTLLLQRELDLVILAPDELRQRQFINALQVCRPFGLTVLLPPELFDFSLRSYRLSRLLSPPLIELRLRVSEPFESFIKRMADIIFSLALLIALAPVFLILALLVRLDSRGPAFFHQVRVGRRGQHFSMHKFRSMGLNAEPDGPQLTAPEDPRMTRVGRWLRHHHLDELPQLWNVLTGDMSLVGPRPERPFFMDRIRAMAPEVDSVLHIRPGIVGWAQLVNGYARTPEQMLNRLRYDLLYVQHQSWVLDLKIALLSIKRIVLGEPS